MKVTVTDASPRWPLSSQRSLKVAPLPRQKRKPDILLFPCEPEPDLTPPTTGPDNILRPHRPQQQDTTHHIGFNPPYNQDTRRENNEEEAEEEREPEE